ncbi:MAG: TPM domain-containing protein [Bacteroides sp.]|nr:TPM domain-containing protein [Bacteroides sp.]MCM1389264.1 TPM domain-containing protein [Bacteroides sp.]
MKYRLVTLFIQLMLVAGISAREYRPEEIPNVHVADRTRYVSNPDNILSPEAEAGINTTLSELWKNTSSEVVVVVVENIAGGDIDSFATDLFTKWGIGKRDKDNGLLFLVSVNDRRMAIRTGYGMEGVVPDIIAGRIIRNIVTPHFKEGDYDGGVTAAVNEISRLASTPGATEELMSKYENDADASRGDDSEELFSMWLGTGVALAAFLLVWLAWTLLRTRRDDRYDRYMALKRMMIPAAIIGFVGLGIPFVVTFLIWLTMRYQRTRRRICPNCQHKMRRLDEQTDNQYLTPAQDLEEKLDSVDYDVWLCDNCGETDILPFVNQHSIYQVCPKCGAKAASLRSDRVIRKPTEFNEGVGIREYVCRNCGNHTQTSYNIPKVIVPPVVIIPGGGGKGGFGGGGFSGGSFGGGMTGGGGASGGW